MKKQVASLKCLSPAGNIKKKHSSVNVFDDGAVLLVSVFWTLSIVIVFFSEGWLDPTDPTV
jgi:hypothetical protein